MIDLPAIRARLEKASPGPWHSEMPEDTSYGFIRPSKPDGSMDGWQIARTMAVEHYGQPSEVPGTGAANTEFIAHARQDIPALLDEIERLQQWVDGLQEDIERLKRLHCDP